VRAADECVRVEHNLRVVDKWVSAAQVNGNARARRVRSEISKQLWDTNSYDAAAETGHVEVMEYMYNHGLLVKKRGTCFVAARHGQLEVLKWLRKHVHWPWKTFNMGGIPDLPAQAPGSSRVGARRSFPGA